MVRKLPSYLIGCIILMLMALPSFAQIQTINFETAGAGYTTTETYGNINQYWQRFLAANEDAGTGTDDHNLVTPATGFQGTAYFAAENTTTERSLITNAVSVIPYQDLQLKILLAATGSGYDASQDYLIIEYSYNGTTFSPLGAFAGASGAFRVDANSDGTGDGTTLTAAMAEFTYNIPKTGTNLQIRLRHFSSAADEELVIDNIRIEGTATTDTTEPTLAITRNAVTLGSFTGTTDATVSFSLAFSELIDNSTFTIADISINNPGGVTFTAPSAGDLTTSDNQNYTFTINGITAGSGALSITVGPNIFDLSGNDMAAAEGPSAAITIDNAAPSFSSVAVSPSSGTSKIGDVVTITLTANGLEQSFNAGTITVNGQTASFLDNADGTYTVTYTVASGNADWGAGALPISIQVTDDSGNAATVTAFTDGNTLAGDANAPTNQNTVFATSVASVPGGTVTIVSSGTASNQVWFAPSGTISFVVGPTMTLAASGTSTSILAPTTPGSYKLFVLDQAGNPSSESTATLHVFSQATNVVFGAPGANTELVFQWTAGGGGNRIVLVKTSGAAYTLADGTNPTPNLAFGSGPDLNGGTAGTVKCVFNGATNGPITVTGLASGTSYEIEVYEYTTGNLYIRPPLTISRSTINSSNPTTAATAMVFSNITGTSMNVQFSQGNGAASVLVARAGSAVSFTPSDGVSYSPNTDFSAGVDLGSGNKIIAIRTDAASGTPITVTGLNANTTYHFAVFEMNGTAGNGSENYSTVNLTGNRKTEPSLQATITGIDNITETSMRVNWTNGNGDRRLIIMREGGAVATDPTDQTTYTEGADFDFGVSPTGSAIGAGYVVYEGSSSSSITITNLLPGTPYHFAIYEYNGSDLSSAAYLTPGDPENASTLADNTDPAGGTVGALTTVGGRVVASYWNSTNTQLQVVVPLASTDGSLDGGSVQVLIKMTSDAGFTAVVGSGMSAITSTDRENGTITVTVNEADLINAGMTEGNSGGLRSAETELLIVSAVVTDLAGNTSPNYTASSTTIDVDQTLPIISSSVVVAPGAGGGGRDVIQFLMSEPMSDHAATPAERINGFQFISANNTFGGNGISVGGGTTTGVTNQVDYVYQGATNSIVSTFVNTRLIYVESEANSATWDASNGTQIQYVQGGPASTSAFVLRDPAGNELDSDTWNAVAGATTTLGLANSGLNPGPNINGGSAGQVLFAFSLTANANVSVTAINVAASSDPDATLNNIQLWGSGNLHDFSFAGPLTATVTTPGNSVDFASVGGINLTPGVTQYFYVVANVLNSFPTATPSIQFSMTSGSLPNASGGFTVSTGAYAGSAQTGPTYNFIDIVNPTVSSVTLPSPNNNNSGTVNFTVNFSEFVTIANNLDFETFGTASGGGESISRSGSNGTYTVTINNIGKEGTLGLRIRDINGSITDLQGNPLNVPGVGFSSGTYQVYAPEPANDVTTLTVNTLTTTSVTLTWTDVATYPVPHGYYVTAERSGDTAPAPVDGTQPGVNQTDIFNNTTGYQLVPAGTQSATFTLLSGVGYTFRIYPYTNSGARIDYRVNTPDIEIATTPTATTGRMDTAPNSFILTDISSLQNTYIVGDGSSSDPGRSLFIALVDDGSSSGSDNAPTRFSQLIITAGAGNTVPDWSEVIEEARLGSANSFSPWSGEIAYVTTTNITSNSITFVLPTGDNQIGELDDNETKFYELRIRLKAPLDNSNGVRSIIDGRRFEFEINAATAFTYGTGSSQIAATIATSDLSDLNANNRVSVIATHLNFVQQPSNALLGVNMSPSVSAEATDVHGNRDLNFSGSVPIASTGTMTAANANLASGIGIASVVHTAKATNRTISGSFAGLTSTPNSNTFDITASNQSDIILDNSFPEPTDILYTQFQTNNIGTIAPNLGVQVARFVLRDGGGAADADAAGTTLTEITFGVSNWEALRRIALYDNLGVELGEQPAGPTVTFTGLNYSTVDNGTRNFTVRVSFQNSPTVITDNERIEFQITNALTSNSSSEFAATNAGGATSSQVLTENRIEVVATQLVFTTQPPALGFLNTDLSASPEVVAQDANGALDLDYEPGTGITINNAGGLTMVNLPTAFVAGVLSFPSNFRYTTAGNGTLTVSSSTVPPNGSAAPLPVSSTGITIRGAESGTITAGPDPEPATLSSIVNNTPGVQVFDFTITDDASTEDDGADMQLDYLYLIGGIGDQLGTYDWANAIDGATLTDGTNTVSVDVIGTSYLGFSFASAQGILLGNIPDDGNKTFKLNIWLKQILGSPLPIEIDGLRFQFEVVEGNVFTNGNGSSLITNEVENSGIANEIDVTATRIDFINPPTPPGNTTASLNSPFAVTVHARDANGNLDLDFTGTDSEITGLSNVVGATMSSTPPVLGSNFTNGIFNFPADFQFTSGNNNDNVTLTIVAGLNSLPSVTSATGITPTITLTSSFESVLVIDPLFTPVLDIPYISNQDINNQGTSFELTRFRLNDGNGTTPDLDGAPTNIDDLTLSITNPDNVRALGIYLGPTLVQSRTNAQFVPGSPTTVTFENLSASIFAPDNGNQVFTLRASFFNTAAEITDNEAIQVQVVNVTQSGGSQFNNIVANPIGGITNGAISASNVQIEVLATRLDFTTQPEAFEGINQPLVTTPIVQARDANAVVDLDQNNFGTLSSAAGLSATSIVFVNGVMTMTGLQYTSPGIGTLTVSSINSLGNAIASNAGGSTACTPVDVIHVTANLIPAGSGGVLGTPNIKGGSIGAVIFGFTFEANHVTASEPTLNGFSITFDNPYKVGGSEVLKNFKVFESTNGTFAGSTDIAALTGAIATVESVASSGNFDKLNITFGTPRTLYQAGVTRSYFLVADVDVTANISTPAMTARLIDRGFGDPTNNHILTSEGSATAEAIGQTYSFASTRPPQLITSSPFNGQLNVDPALGQIDLYFDVDVLTFDGVAELYDRKYNKLIATLPALNGVFNGDINDLASQTVTPLSFDIPAGVVLKPDSLYYLRIAPGSYDPVAGEGTGISDEGQNFYGGISYNGTLYFKISSPNPPNMVRTDENKYFVSNSAAVFNAAFDQFGTGFYLVIDKGIAGTYTAPTNAEIAAPNLLNPAYVTHGTFNIEQLSPNLQSVAFSASLTPGGVYDIWVYAQNDAQPTPIAVSAPYGKLSPHTPGGAGPTITLNVPATITSNSNRPIIQVCPNSEAIVTDAIVIGESAPGDFSGGAQNFNLLLPTGFQFDISDLPSVVLSGSDFTSAPTVSFVNATILNIAFNNTGAASLDNFIISDFTILASQPGAISSITRFAGVGLGSVPDGTTVATLFAKPVETQDFSNTYTTSNDFSGVGLGNRVINVIPDNFNLPSAEVRLLPTIIPETDYGPSFFSGPGVTNDILNLTGVALNTAFDITMTHTDLNGCISTTTEQYLVYDHQAAIPIIGTEACITNINFPTGDSPPLDSPILSFNAKAGYFLVELFANIPSSATAQSQIMFGPDWQDLVSQIPYVESTSSVYKNYKWDYSVILNAVTESSGAISVNPYNNDVFADTTLNNRPYWRGGSLGVVEFTGRYRNSADLSVEVPFRQEVRLFVPPIPVIEVSQSSALAGTTPIYCESGSGDVIINGFPLATAGVSTGFFVLRDSASNAVIFNSTTPLAGFRDNSNGTANLTPSTVAATLNALQANRGYRTILVEYTFRENNSPCSGTARAYLRVAPNPVAAFTVTSEITENTPLGTEACEGIRLNFDGAGSAIAQGTIAEYRWNFGDATGSSGSNPNEAIGATASHIYGTSAVYAPTLTARSIYGCNSAPASEPLNVGSIPVVDFTFEGVSTADLISFESESVLNSAGAVNDNFATLNWTYGNGNSQSVTSNFANAVTNNYATAGIYTVTLRATSVIGCTEDIDKTIIVVPRVTPTEAAAYNQGFESTDGGWQTSSLDGSASTWAAGAPSKATIVLTEKTGNGIWTTNLTGTYSPLERSALYSPSFDLSELDRPMISFDHFTRLAAGEGVVIEFSTDNKNLADPTKVWAVLGEVNSGVDWYDANGLSSQPGFANLQGWGWTGLDTEWDESKHVLDAVLNSPQVVFRFALATLTSSPTLDGFAIDNVRIGNRTRTVLVENFRNLGGNAAVEETESTNLRTFKNGAVGTRLVKLNYHVGFPERDPFNLDNPQDPSSRALYYNIKATPIVRMDGDGEDGLFSAWGSRYYDEQTLKLSNALLIPTVDVANDGSINVDVTVQAVGRTLPVNATLLHVALVEKLVPRNNLPQAMRDLVRTNESEFEYVLKKMLPSARGTRLTQTLTDGQQQTYTATEFQFSWTPERSRLYTEDNLAVVVFLQDELTREVYQAEIVDVGNDPDEVTGLEPGLTISDVTLYPNPADEEVTIVLPRAAVADVNVQLFDQAGRALQQSKIPKGDREKTLNVKDLPASIYLIKLEENGVVTFKRAMVVHRN